MKNFLKEYPGLIVVPLLVLVVFACLSFAAYASGKYECQARTAQIGYDSRYSFWGGCQIEVNDNQWIPLGSYYFKQE